MTTNEIISTVAEDQAKVNVTYAGQNGELPAPVSLASTEEDIRQMVTEALRGGGIPGIPADPDADISGYVVKTFDPTVARPHHLINVRPKTEFGDELDGEVKKLVELAHRGGVEKEDLVFQVVTTWEDLYED